MNVLIVDDNELAARALARIIEREGHTVAVTREPTQALRLVRRLDIDLVITDERMPGMAGSEILATLARLRPQCFRALTTGLTNATLLVALINESRVEYVLEKPFDIERVRALLRLAHNEKRCQARRRTTTYANAWSKLERDEAGAIVIAADARAEA